MTADHMYWTLAHQGGWDELLMFGIPIVIAVVGVRWAEKRAKAKRTSTAQHSDKLADEDEPR